LKEIKTFASCKDGKFKVSYQKKFVDAIVSMGDTNGELTYRKKFKKRSTQVYHEDGSETRGENGYFWGVVCQCYIDGALAEQGRYINMKQSHDELVSNCSYLEHYNEETGTVMREPVPTSGMNTEEFENFLQRCREFIKEWFNIEVPLPNTQSELKLEE
jgi:hypothetical protein